MRIFSKRFKAKRKKENKVLDIWGKDKLNWMAVALRITMKGMYNG